MQGLKQFMGLMVKTVVVFSLIFTMGSAYAYPNITFTSYRLALDDKNRQQSLTLRNKGHQPARCTLGYTHYKITKTGEFISVKTADELPHSASPLLRYSPSRVSIPANSSQTVRIALKRSRELADGEYATFLRISCKDDLRGLKAESMVGVVPTISYNIPVVVRVGKQNVVVSLSDAVLKGQELTVNLNRKGSRSVYGTLKVTDINSNKELDFTSQISVYQETNTKQLKLNLTEKPTGPLLINFKETHEGKNGVEANLKL